VSECQHCSQTPEQHEESSAANAVDFVTLRLLGKQSGGSYEEVVERILTDWRTHALPECDPLAIS
jgi:hypothetical protein